MDIKKRYLERKSREVELISNKTKWVTDSIFEAIMNKKEAVSCAKIDFLEKNKYLSNTFFKNRDYECKGYNISYGYQRFDIDIKFQNYLSFLYGLKHENYSYYFTNCGMSAISIFLLSLVTSTECKLHITRPLYVETEKLLVNIENAYLKTSNLKKYDVLYLDSIDGNIVDKYHDGRAQLGRFFLVIIDTSCWESLAFRDLISEIINDNQICILLRSHIKLDMLGTEYSTLGSICTVLPNDSTQIDLEQTRKIMYNVKVNLSLFGAYAYPNELIPFWNESFIKLNGIRISIIKQNVRFAYEEIKRTCKNVDIEKPFHDLYVLIHINGIIEYDLLRNMLEGFIDNFKVRSDIPLFYSGSFALDHCAFDVFCKDITTSVIRFSPSDYPKKDIKYIVATFACWLRTIDENRN